MSTKVVNAVRERESRIRRAEIVAVAQPKKVKLAKAAAAVEVAKPKRAPKVYQAPDPEPVEVPETVTSTTRTWGEVTSFYPEQSDEPAVETGDTEPEAVTE